MISVIFYKSRNEYVGLKCSGHAGFADKGKDLVCCAVSTLVINTINSIEELTNAKFEIKSDEASGLIDFHLISEADRDTSILFGSLYLGIKDLSKQYKKYVKIEIKEV